MFEKPAGDPAAGTAPAQANAPVPETAQAITMDTATLVRHARETLAALTGLTPDSVVRIDRTDGEWRLAIDMVEHKAIPETNDLLATFDAAFDAQGNVLRYERTRRYHRGQTGD